MSTSSNGRIEGYAHALFEVAKGEGNLDEVEFATLTWVDWFNQTRLHSSIGHVPPIEFEDAHYRHINPRQHPLPGEPALH